MVFDDSSVTLDQILQSNTWLPELAGILPISALLDFINTPEKLHILQLVGGVPLWNWPITPAGSLLLLNVNDESDFCYLDKFGNSIGLMATDGRYGDNFHVPNSMTIRLCLSSTKPQVIKNSHENMKIEEQRIHDLEIINISRPTSPASAYPSSSLFAPYPFVNSSLRYFIVSTAGWVTLISCIILAAFLECFVGMAFLILVPATGYLVYLLHGSRPRTPKRQSFGTPDRIIIVTEHPNSTKWIVFCGEGTLINPLLNLPLTARGKSLGPTTKKIILIALRALILLQWSAVLASATLKNWNSFIICFWIILCILTNTYILPSEVGVQCWIKFYANISIKRYQTKVSSRRALLNTIIALNPDVVPWSKKNQSPPEANKWAQDAMTWIDPILKECPDRTTWEMASRKALAHSAGNFSIEQLASDDLISAVLESDNELLKTEDKAMDGYWRKYILEGIFMAAKIKIATGLSQEDRKSV